METLGGRNPLNAPGAEGMDDALVRERDCLYGLVVGSCHLLVRQILIDANHAKRSVLFTLARQAPCRIRINDEFIRVKFVGSYVVAFADGGHGWYYDVEQRQRDVVVVCCCRRVRKIIMRTRKRRDDGDERIVLSFFFCGTLGKFR